MDEKVLFFKSRPNKLSLIFNLIILIGTFALTIFIFYLLVLFHLTLNGMSGEEGVSYGLLFIPILGVFGYILFGMLLVYLILTIITVVVGIKSHFSKKYSIYSIVVASFPLSILGINLYTIIIGGRHESILNFVIIFLTFVFFAFDLIIQICSLKMFDRR